MYKMKYYFITFETYVRVEIETYIVSVHEFNKRKTWSECFFKYVCVGGICVCVGVQYIIDKQ